MEKNIESEYLNNNQINPLNIIIIIFICQIQKFLSKNTPINSEISLLR
jgi:hypothetical protein